MDFSVICGHRGEKDQNKAVEQGYSKIKYPKSKHNTFPSRAVDIAPYPSLYKNEKKFHELAGVIKSEAIRQNIHIIWGGDWNNFIDLPHYELGKEEL